MAFTPTSYTQRGWAVAQKSVDTVTSTCPNATKNITVANLNWSTDYSTKSESASECEVINITGTSLTAPAIVRIGYKDIKDVYANTRLTPTKLANKAGVQVMVSLEELYSASNTTTGEEGDLPVKAWLCLCMPTHPSANTTLLESSIKRTLGALFATDATDTSLLQHIIRQKLNPCE